MTTPRLAPTRAWEPGTPVCRPGDRGASAIDLVFLVAVLGTLLAMSIPAFGNARARARGEGAARFLTTLCRSARAEAARQRATVGLRFVVQGGRVAIGAHIDGDGDGISTSDLLDGTDPPLGPARYLDDDFPGVAIAIRENLPGIDGSAALTASANPLQIGSRGVLSFTPDGLSSGGTVYLAADDDTAYAVRILSSTGRARVLRYGRGSSQWELP